MNFKKMLSDRLDYTALFVVTIPLLGYLLALMFEYGYLSSYGVDFDTVSIKPQLVIVAVFTFLFIISILVQIFDAIYPFLKNKKSRANETSRYEFILVVYICIGIFSLVFLALTSKSIFHLFYSLMLGGLLGYLLINYLFLNLYYLMVHRNWRKAWENAAKHYLKSNRVEFTQNSKLYSFLITFIITLAVISSVGYIAGKTAADRVSSSYKYIEQNNTQLVVVRQYNDLLILKTLDQNTNHLKKGYQISKIDKEVKINYHETGKKFIVE